MSSLSDLILEDPLLSDLILVNLGLIELYQFRRTCPSPKRAVERHLDRRPSMIVLGGLCTELDDDDVESPAEISGRVHGFRLSTMDWYALPSMTMPRFAFAACSLNDGSNQIFVAGGVKSLGSDALANQSVFVEGPDRSMRAQPTHEAGTHSWRGRNAQRGLMTDGVELFDAESATWMELPPLPVPRAGARACLDGTGRRVLVVGGSTPKRGYCRDVEVFDLDKGQWLVGEEKRRAVPPMNLARTEFALARVPGRGIFVAGGTNRFLWPNSPLTSEFFDFGTGRWEVLAPPPLGKYDEPGVISVTEELGGDCALLEDNRHVVLYGGLHIESEYRAGRA